MKSWEYSSCNFERIEIVLYNYPIIYNLCSQSIEFQGNFRRFFLFQIINCMYFKNVLELGSVFVLSAPSTYFSTDCFSQPLYDI